VKSYLIDEIGAEDVLRIRRFLAETAIASGMDSLFWVKVPDSLLTPLQREHLPCRPHVIAVETGERFVKAELYLRTLRDMRCPCQAYCTLQQAQFIMERLNEMLKELSIGT
jgi:hypothetical protein